MGAVQAEPDAVAPDDLLAFALSRPHDAIAAARTILAGRPSLHQSSVARQAAGIGLREIGEVAAAVRELRAALRLARKTGDHDREVDVIASLGATLGRAGRLREGLAVLDVGVRSSRGALAGRVLLRRADVLLVMGRYTEALADLRGAVTRLRRAGDLVWEARSMAYRGSVQLALGSTRRADEDFAVAERLFAATGQEFEYAQAVNNRGLAAFARGDLPTALAYLDEAGHRFEALGAPEPNLAMDRCAVLLAAGLAPEALREAEKAAARIEKEGGQATRRAELLFAAATAAVAAADPATAIDQAEQARRAFQAQHRHWWAAHAELVAVEARYAAGDRTSALFRQAEQLAARLTRLRTTEAPRAHLLAGRLALAHRLCGPADTHLQTAADSRRHGPPLSRSTGWLAQALLSTAHGRVRATLAACRRGLDTLDEHRMALGSTELRAHATARGAELAALAQRDALRRGDARRLLVWSERWRATALAVPPIRPPDDERLVSELAALRDVVRRLNTARPDGRAEAGLERDRRNLESAVRARTRHAAGHATTGQIQRFELDALSACLDDTRMVELVELDGVLHAIVIGGGRVRLHTVGPDADAQREVELARFRLRRLAHARPSALAGPSLDRFGERLERVLLGPAAAGLGDGPVVVVPPGQLNAVPWALLPSLRHRVLSVAPSAATWMRARQAPAPDRQRVALVYGPGLSTGGAEVPALARFYRDADVLGNGTATAERVLAALDGAWLAHIAAHGNFRSDSPLFSALTVDDGPLTVHDFERLKRAPHRLVLSSCESGLAKPVGADELLGLTTGLVPLGASEILASVVPVNDPAAVPLMIALHSRLGAGATLAQALLDARVSVEDDPLTAATGQSFVVLGG